MFGDMNGRKQVHFQEPEDHSFSPSSLESSISSSSSVDKAPIRWKDQLQRANSLNGFDSSGNVTNNAADKKHSSKLVRSPSSPNASMHAGRLLTVSPADELIFQAQDSGDPFDTITLTNVLPHSVAFKVKTTSPEKFRVRPSSGIIRPDNSETIRVNLVSEHAEDVSKEKFLIMAIDTQGKSADLGQLFKEATSDKVMQHKLRCSLGTQEDIQEQTTFQTTSQTLTPSRGDDLALKVGQLEVQTLRMQKQINLLLIIQLLTTFFLLLAVAMYSCFGKELFTHFLTFPFYFCQVSQR